MVFPTSGIWTLLLIYCLGWPTVNQPRLPEMDHLSRFVSPGLHVKETHYCSEHFGACLILNRSLGSEWGDWLVGGCMCELRGTIASLILLALGQVNTIFN